MGHVAKVQVAGQMIGAGTILLTHQGMGVVRTIADTVKPILQPAAATVQSV